MVYTYNPSRPMHHNISYNHTFSPQSTALLLVSFGSHPLFHCQATLLFKFSTLKQTHSQCLGIICVQPLGTDWFIGMRIVVRVGSLSQVFLFFYFWVDEGARAFLIAAVRSMTTTTRPHQSHDNFYVLPPCHAMLYLRVML